MSSYRVVGRFAASRVQCAPLSCDTKSARSVPAKRTSGLPGYSARPRIDASSVGRPLVTAVHVLPKSVVRNTYGAKSPSRCASNETYAVPRDAADATMSPTNVPSFTPVIAPLSSVHEAPPSVVSCTLPSSVPTHRIFGSIGDSAKFEISLMPSPSFRESLTSRLATPIISIESRSIERVRSLLRVHVEPKSFDVKRRLPPRYTVPDVCRDAMTGASQSKRYGGSPAGGRGLMSSRSPVIGSTSERLPLLDEEETFRESLLSTALPVPSLKPISVQS